jgi:GDPmannose 4,6-dehydratase
VPRALVTGIGGQDGSLLAELLLARGYEVVGTVRDASRRYENLDVVRERVELLELDLTSEAEVVRALERWQPNEVYNLASISLVPRSWDDPVAVTDVGARGVAALLEAIRRGAPDTRFFQASSAEIFGEAREAPQSERTPLAPLSPYGCAKAFGHFLTGAYRRRFGLFACSGILYNHESPRRAPEFVTRKITRAAASISLGLEREVALGSLEARRDWGYAGDTVRAMWLMLQADEPDDYVVATGEAHSVEELVAIAFEHVGLDWREHVVTDERLTRGPSEIWLQVGDASKARERLGWAPTVTFPELVRLMVDADLERLRANVARGGVQT